jgi:RNA polymerase sigma-70 factor (ECF subfamily)
LKRNAIGTAGIGGESDGLLESMAAPEADSAWTANFNTHVLRSALERVRPRFEASTWRAFELVWIENVPARDVAREMKQPIDFVYVAKSRVLKKLREEVMTLAEDIPIYTPLNS